MKNFFFFVFNRILLPLLFTIVQILLQQNCITEVSAKHGNLLAMRTRLVNGIFLNLLKNI